MKDLISLLPPPQAPTEVPTQHDWQSVEEALSELPTDYKDFVELYGSGSIDEFVTVFNPVAGNRNLNLLHQYDVRLGALRELSASGSERIPYRLFPEREGILPFGSSDNGDVLYWITTGGPDSWTVVVNSARSPDWEEFRVGVTEFLRAILSRQEVCRLFPLDFPSNAPRFGAFRTYDKERPQLEAASKEGVACCGLPCHSRCRRSCCGTPPRQSSPHR